MISIYIVPSNYTGDTFEFVRRLLLCSILIYFTPFDLNSTGGLCGVILAKAEVIDDCELGTLDILIDKEEVDEVRQKQQLSML